MDGTTVDVFKMLGTLITLLRYGGIILAAFCYFTKRRDKLAVIGIGLVAASWLVSAVLSSFSLEILVRLAAWVLMLLIARDGLMGDKPEKYQNIWYLPAAIYAASFPVYIVLGFLGHGFFAIAVVSNIVRTLLYSAILLGFSVWTLYPNGLPHEQFGDDGATDSFSGDGYCGIIKHLLLSTFTLGIWQLMWLHRTTRYLNQVEGHERMKPSTQVIAGLFVPFYLTYWTYKNAMKLDDLSRQYGYTFKLTLPCLALKVLSPLNIILPSMVMQERINTIAMCKAGAIPAPVPMEDNPDQLPEL